MSDTRQRVAVREELARDDAFRSAQDVHARLRATGTRIGLTTVYRALQAMAESGEVDVMRQPDGESVYRRCSSDRHHHHLVCRSCGTTVEVDGPAVERWADRVAAEHGYADVSHTLEVFGTCRDCRH
jgi:Fur family transcriptional regulator, ferric uptake regulator